MPPFVGVLLAAAIALTIAGWTYLRREGLDRRPWALIVLRTIALGGTLVLLLDLSCGIRPFGTRPLVLLDGSLSMSAAGGGWRVARDSAERWGVVRTFGDGRLVDSLPDRGTSRLRDALVAAAADGRQVVIVTDGELDDLPGIPRDLLDAARIRVFPRRAVPDLFVTHLTVPGHVSLDDTVQIEATVGRTPTGPDSATVTFLAGRHLGTRAVRFRGASEAKVALRVAARTLGAGAQLIRVAIRGTPDSEPRDDERWGMVQVAATPGVVLLAAPPDWESRQLYRTLREVSGLPVRGYARFGSAWRTMDALAPVSAGAVAAAAGRADLLVLVGDPLTRSTARARWTWPAGAGDPAPITGDWYVTSPGPSPLSGAWVDLPLDSLPPLTEVVPAEPPPAGWVGLSAQAGRRGAARPVVVGGGRAGGRMVTMLGGGFWRWAFRGGASAEGYRTLVATVTAWLLGADDPAAGHVRPLEAVVPRGVPVRFEWTGPGTPRSLPFRWSGDRSSGTDTLRFDGSGSAAILLPVGRYDYRLDDGGRGVVAVEPWSREWLPRPPVVQDREPSRSGSGGLPRGSRDRLWLFALVLAAFATEWGVRRRRGLR